MLRKKAGGWKGYRPESRAGIRGFLGGLFVTVLFASGGPCIQVRAEEKLAFTAFETGGDTEGNIEVRCAEDGSTLRMSYQFDEEGYHTVTAFQNDHWRIDTEGGLCLRLENKSKLPVRMNVAVIDQNGNVLQVQDGSFIQTREAREEFIKAENGCFELPADFYGEIRVPFGVLNTGAGKASDHGLDEIMGYGIVCVAEGENAYCVEMDKLWLEDAEKMPDPTESCILQIEGEEEILRPKLGESKSFYRGILYNMRGESREIPVSFSLEQPVPGIRLEQDGWVCIGTEAAEESFILKAATGNGICAEREIKLYDSWTQTNRTDNGYDASLAKPEEIAPILNWGSLLISEAGLWCVRGLAVVAAAAFLGYYVGVRRRERRKR